ncbi:MAG: right-handed parallel beta-helix repeat-containing protein [Chloroflexota bacterium]
MIVLTILVSQASLLANLSNSALEKLAGLHIDFGASESALTLPTAGELPTTMPALDQAKAGGNSTAIPARTAVPQPAAQGPSVASTSAAAALSLSPAAGLMGTDVFVTGANFPASRMVQLTWNGAALGNAVKTSANGDLYSIVTVPSSPVGLNTLGASVVESTSLIQFPWDKPNLGPRLASAVFAVSVAAPSSAVGSTPAPRSGASSPPSGAPAPTSSAPTQSSTAPTAAPTAPPATAVPTNAPTAPPPSASAPPAPALCPSLQGVVNAAAAGAVVTVATCVYRETITITKPLTLRAQPGAEIRGSDVWTAFSGSGPWVSEKTAPALSAYGECRAGTSRCLWPEQVFVDSVALLQVAANPAAGQFALDGSRHIVLGANPVGRLVEVTVRKQWLIAAADDVTVDGFRMKHAANTVQTGGIQGDGSHSRLTIKNSVLSDTHGAVVSLRNADSMLLGSDVSRGGNLGVHGAGARAIYRGNRIHHNNTEDYAPGWEAGGLKSVISDQTVENNEVFSNDGVGIWYDIHATGVTIAGNRVHHNRDSGIAYEISSFGRITGNTVWENGWRSPAWGWGAGIILSGSNNTEVSGNVVAWNADGVSVIAQNRPDAPGPVSGNYVHDNVIVTSHQSSDKSDVMNLGWLQDAPMGMYDAGRNNRGAANRYWTDKPEPTYCLFQWIGCISALAAFNGTPGEEGGQYLTTAERDQKLASSGLPTAPEIH